MKHISTTKQKLELFKHTSTEKKKKKKNSAASCVLDILSIVFSFRYK